MYPKLEKARQVRASMALQAQSLAPAAAGELVWLNLPPPVPLLSFGFKHTHMHSYSDRSSHLSIYDKLKKQKIIPMCNTHS